MTNSPLGDLSVDDFLANYWQQKPLVIRQGFANFSCPISPNELAGLACEEDVNARLVVEHSNPPWQVYYGPLDEQIYATLPESHWTLLVNDVEKWLPELCWIIDQFRFIPEWMIDDLMISYAPQGGSVGPHLDQYDVFILQAQGHRRWQIHQQPVADDNQIDDIDLCIQKTFEPEQEWVLSPGDLIYIPPGTSHYGVAEDDCMSFSIGFRAPAKQDLLQDFLNHFAEQQAQDLFRIPTLTTQPHPCEVTDSAVAQAQALLQSFLGSDKARFKQWLTQFLSENPNCDYPELETPWQLDDIQSTQFQRNPASRFVFSQTNDSTWLYVDGQRYESSRLFAEKLCQQREVNLLSLTLDLNAVDKKTLVTLINQQKLIAIEP